MADGRIRVALDAMGGDDGPAMVVKGAVRALRQTPDLDLILVGDQSRLEAMVARQRGVDPGRLRIIHADGVVRNEDKPSVALRQGGESSMRKAIDLVRDGQADCVVSAGNTGALMAMSKISLRMLKGISRPAMVTRLPTRSGECCMLDLGANVECDAENLIQFALMGAIFATVVGGVAHPHVGLLNVGSEEQKGHDELREAAAALRQLSGGYFTFHGFVEGDDIARGTVDVVVTDGFTGNIALKTAEGTARMLFGSMRAAIKSSFFGRLGFLLSHVALRQVRQRFDPRSHNGAVFVGLNGISVKSHGGTDMIGFANAIGVATELVRRDFLVQVRERVEGLRPIAGDDGGGAADYA
ncbi:MAG: phosphate acyltransferase PlsX [Pseudomonadota bacterium]|nr:phosphate acyltransferase PlsX [Pseudomonadota bacterium]